MARLGILTLEPLMAGAKLHMLRHVCPRSDWAVFDGVPVVLVELDSATKTQTPSTAKITQSSASMMHSHQVPCRQAYQEYKHNTGHGSGVDICSGCCLFNQHCFENQQLLFTLHLGEQIVACLVLCGIPKWCRCVSCFIIFTQQCQG